LLQTTLDKHPDAVGFAAIDSKAAGPLMQQAKTDKIPVIAFDSGVDSDVPICTASTDNLAAAAEAAKHMADLIGHEGKIALVVHDQTSVTGVQRRDGFVDYMKKNEPKVQIVDIQYSGDPLKAPTLAKAMIAANPTSRACTARTRRGHRRRARGAGARHHGQAADVGFDSGKDQIDAINSGLMAGASPRTGRHRL
jgi:ribose transport system substrate-binding protein